MKDTQHLADNYDAETLLTAAGLKLAREGHDDLASDTFDVREELENAPSEEES